MLCEVAASVGYVHKLGDIYLYLRSPIDGATYTAVAIFEFARVPQSAIPWTDGGLCDVLQPSHGNFPLVNLSNPLVNLYAFRYRMPHSWQESVV